MTAWLAERVVPAGDRVFDNPEHKDPPLSPRENNEFDWFAVHFRCARFIDILTVDVPLATGAFSLPCWAGGAPGPCYERWKIWRQHHRAREVSDRPRDASSRILRLCFPLQSATLACVRSSEHPIYLAPPDSLLGSIFTRANRRP